jgi:hypothetical protein
MEERRWRRSIAAKVQLGKEPCAYCCGVGYVQRLHDRSRVKCVVCDGSGDDPKKELQRGLVEHLFVREAEPFPTIVCLCGSTRFWREFQAASLRETLAGKIVLSIGAASGTDDEHFGNLPREEYDRVKAMLGELHLRKIDLADDVLILNCGGYIGPSTARELAYARQLDKTIRFLEPEQ